MKCLRHLFLAAACVMPAAILAEPSTSERLDLLERRVSRITDITLQLEEVRRENRELRGQVENLGHEMEQLERKQRDLYLDIDQRLGSGQSAGTPPVSASDSARAGSPAAVETRTPQPQLAASATDRKQIEAEYQAAYDLLSPQSRRYEEAAKAFTVFLKKYPDDELAPNAQYWLGEANYVSQHNAEAQQAFELVVSKYPDSTKAPGALFKIGRLEQAAGNNDAARRSYQKVLKDYPDSPAVGLARQRLEKLGAGR
ncbi:MAG: tol-pal system protein YbgF [Sedimenticolaceae bacterium]